MNYHPYAEADWASVCVRCDEREDSANHKSYAELVEDVRDLERRLEQLEAWRYGY